MNVFNALKNSSLNQTENKSPDSDFAGSGFDWFSIESIDKKIERLPAAIDYAFTKLNTLSGSGFEAGGSKITFVLGRDAQVVQPSQLPPKPGLASREGQARLLHDLASIEAQAMELAVRSLFEYPDAPPEFRKELAEIALSESRHLRLCMDGLERLGFRWAHWDVHLMLWNAVSCEDSLLNRILIVHRYLEGSGLDAGESILKRLTGAAEKGARDIVRVIVKDEVDHVLFGSRWYKKIAEQLKINPETDFCERMNHISRLVPRRERLARELRKQAGFTEFELNHLEEIDTAMRSLRP
jgi:uncharacterized ferritin-like protein (DUF455 family)